MSRTRAQWVEGVPDLTSRLDEAGNYLNVAQVHAETGFATATILDLLSRSPITSKTNPQGPLSRPAGRIGNTPLYSPEQVAAAKALLAAGRRQHFGGGPEPLPSISPDEATRRRLLSTDEIAALAITERHPQGVRDQTVRRWSRDHNDFPDRIALRSRRGGRPGVPMVLYNGQKALEWLVAHGYADGDPKVILARFFRDRVDTAVAS